MRDEGRKDEKDENMNEMKTNKIRTVRDLKVYRKAFDCAMDIFELTKQFPKEERYSLTDQIRRASRSVCSNLLIFLLSNLLIFQFTAPPIFSPSQLLIFLN